MARNFPSVATHVNNVVATARKVVVVTTLGVALACVSPAMVHADSLDDEHRRLSGEISRSRENVETYSRKAEAAAAQYTRSQAQLATAQAELGRAQTALTTAKAEDARVAAELRAAQGRMAVATAEASAAQSELAQWEKTSGVRVRQVMQQQNPLADYVVLFSTTKTTEMNQRAQWFRTIQNNTQGKLDQHRKLKLAADTKRAEAVKAEERVAAARRASAEQVSRTAESERQARVAQQNVATATAANLVAKRSADAELAAEEGRLKSLETESAKVSARIKARIAAEKAAAIRKAKAEAAERARKEKAARLARERAAAAAREAKAAEARARAQRTAEARRKAAAARAAAAKAEAASKKANQSSSRPTKSTTRVESSRDLIYPVNGPITSRYGMRFHPVLHRWKLHDGTDFGAGCGTPLRAAADGRVSERYYNGGYGNRLMIDHGKINGSYITTGYNHATHYIVSVGQYVRQGQVVGYVGSTGYSTGCHLHLMVWKDGDVVNPMSVF